MSSDGTATQVGGGTLSGLVRRDAPSVTNRQDAANALYDGLRAKADEELLGGAADRSSPYLAAFTRGGNAAALNIPRNVAAGIATGLGKVGFPGYSERSFSQNYDLAKEQEEALARQAPKSALAGTVAGIGLSAAVAPGAITATSTAGRIGQGLALGGLYGSVGEALDSKDPTETAKAGAIGGVIGGAAVPLADLAIKGGSTLYGMFSRGLPVTNAEGGLTTTAKALLQRAGVAPETLTPEVQARVAQAVGTKGESEAAIREALAGEFGIPLSRGQATGDASAQALEQSMMSGARGRRAQGVGQDLAEQQGEAINATVARFADQAGGGLALDHPMQGLELAADRLAQHGRRLTGEAGAAQQGVETAIGNLRGASPVDRLDASANVRQQLLSEQAQSRARVQDAYSEAARLPGEFHPSAFDDVAARVRDRVDPDLPLGDSVLTPYASRALDDLNNMKGLLGLPEDAGLTAQQVEQVRKRLSAYHPLTEGNPTDRRALGQLRDAFTNHANGLAETRFGPRRTPTETPAAGLADDFRGMPSGGLPAPSSATSRQPPPETMGQYIARNGGLELNGDAQAYDLHKWQVGGLSRLARPRGVPMDTWRVRLAEQGFIPPDHADGSIARDVRDEVYEALRAERQGRPTYRFADEERVANGAKGLDHIASENADHAMQLDRQARRMAIDLEGHGIGAADLDHGALQDAAGMMLRREVDDSAHAYDTAVLRRSEGGRPAGEAASSRGPVGEDAPFPGIGETGPASATDAAFPGATPEGARYAETYRLARSLNQDHASKFKQQGGGDDVGRALEGILKPNAQPVEASRLFYGSNTALATRAADRVKRIVGESSPHWQSYQQGYIDSVLSGTNNSHAAIASRIDDALARDRRGLTYSVLNGQQVAGLHDIRRAINAARASREAVPDFVTNLGRTDFDPLRVSADLFGSGVPGARPGAAAYASGVRNLLGEGSPEWGALRLSAVQKLMMKPDGSGVLPARELQPRILQFVRTPLAKQMFPAATLAEMERFAKAVGSTVTKDGTPLPNGGGTGAKLAGKALDVALAGLGFHFGGLTGAGAAYTSSLGTKVLQSLHQGRIARRTFQGGAPQARDPGPVLDLKPLGIGTGGLAAYGVD